MPSPTISVIVPTLNAGDSLQLCLDSVYAQTYPNVELVVIDGKSSDDTVPIIRANQDRLAYWESSADTGVYHATNKGIDHAKGDWIICLGADDYLLQPDVLQRMSDHLAAAYPTHTLVLGKVALIDTKGQFVKEFGGAPWARVKKLAYTNWVFHSQAAFHHRTIFERRGKYDESFRLAADLDLNLREALLNDPVNVDITVSAFCRGGLSTSPENILVLLREIRRARLKNGLVGAKEHVGGTYLTYSVYRILRPICGKKLAARASHASLSLARKVRLHKVFGSKTGVFD